MPAEELESLLLDIINNDLYTPTQRDAKWHILEMKVQIAQVAAMETISVQLQDLVTK